MTIIVDTYQDAQDLVKILGKYYYVTMAPTYRQDTAIQEIEFWSITYISRTEVANGLATK